MMDRLLLEKSLPVEKAKVLAVKRKTDTTEWQRPIRRSHNLDLI